MSYSGLGVISNMTNAEISDAIIAKMPKHTYTSVRTSAETHYFAGVGNLASRKIVMQRSEVSSALECIAGFFLSFFSQDIANIRYGQQSLNERRILEFFVSNSQNSQNEQEVSMAFINCRTITIFITEDCQQVDIEVKDSQNLTYARAAGVVARLFVDSVPFNRLLAGTKAN